MIEKLQPKTIEKDGGAFGIIVEKRFATDEEICEKINEVIDAVNSLRDDCNLLMGYIAPEDGCELTDNDLRNMMKDPKYWRDKDPETVRRVEEGFKKLYGDKGE